MQNPIQKFRQSSIVFEKLGILPEKLKILTSSNNRWVEYFQLKLCTCLPLTNVYKMVFRIFLFCLDLGLLAKIETGFFAFLLITQDQNKIKILSTLL